MYPGSPPPPPPYGRTDVVLSGAACIRCGTSLQMMPLTGQCRRCGLDVGTSLDQPPIAGEYGYAIQNLRAGMQWLVYIIVIGFTVMIAMTFVVMVMAFQQGMLRPGQPGQPATPTILESTLFTAISTFLSFIYALLQFAAYWKISSPGITPPTTDPRDSVRNTMRGLSIAMIALAATSVPITIIQSMFASQSPGHTILWVMSVGIGLIALGVHAALIWSVMRFIIPIAARIPDATVASQAYTYRWLLPILMTVGMLACGLGPLIATVMYLLLLWQFQSKLGRMMFQPQWSAPIR